MIVTLRWGRVSHLLSYPIAHSATRAEMSDFTQIASQPGHILSRSETSAIRAKCCGLAVGVCRGLFKDRQRAVELFFHR